MHPVAVFITSKNVESYKTEIEWAWQKTLFKYRYAIGRYLIVTTDGPDILHPVDFHDHWKFVNSDLRALELAPVVTK